MKIGGKAILDDLWQQLERLATEDDKAVRKEAAKILGNAISEIVWAVNNNAHVIEALKTAVSELSSRGADPLKTCPICQCRRAELVSSSPPTDPSAAPAWWLPYRVRCTHCGLTTRSCATPAGAADAWNKRAG